MLEQLKHSLKIEEKSEGAAVGSREEAEDVPGCEGDKVEGRTPADRVIPCVLGERTRRE